MSKIELNDEVNVVAMRRSEARKYQQGELAHADQLFDLWSLGHEQLFEDGVQNEFTEALSSAITTNDAQFLSDLTAYCLTGGVSAYVSGKALLVLATIDDKASEDSRVECLAELLSYGEPSLREAAAIALGSIDNPRAKRHLIQARHSEKDARVQRTISRFTA